MKVDERKHKYSCSIDLMEAVRALDYQNRRPDHLAALWQIVDWEVVASRYEAELKI